MRRVNFEGKGAVYCKVYGYFAVSCGKVAKPIDMPLGMDSSWSRKHVLDGGAHWRNLENTIEVSMCGGDAAFSSNYFDHLFMKYHCPYGT